MIAISNPDFYIDREAINMLTDLCKDVLHDLIGRSKRERIGGHDRQGNTFIPLNIGVNSRKHCGDIPGCKIFIDLLDKFGVFHNSIIEDRER
jgi:hypothetical protein